MHPHTHTQTCSDERTSWFQWNIHSSGGRNEWSQGMMDLLWNIEKGIKWDKGLFSRAAGRPPPSKNKPSFPSFHCFAPLPTPPPSLISTVHTLTHTDCVSASFVPRRLLCVQPEPLCYELGGNRNQRSFRVFCNLFSPLLFPSHRSIPSLMI